jgi:hypothetical protein
MDDSIAKRPDDARQGVQKYFESKHTADDCHAVQQHGSD